MATVTVSMPDSMKLFLDAEVETKGFGNTSEYIRSLLREAQHRNEDARLQSLLLEGLGSGQPISVNDRFWRELRAEASALGARHQTSARAPERKRKKKP